MEALTIQEIVSEYMDKHPNHKPKHLIKKFPNIKFGTLKMSLFRWRQKKRQDDIKLQQNNVKTTKNNRFITNKNIEPIIIPKYSERVKCPHCPGMYANELMKFVGFRGSMDKQGICTIDIKGTEHSGEAWPPPIAPITKWNVHNLRRLTGKQDLKIGQRIFLGILQFQMEVLTLKFALRGMGYTDVMILMPRGEGKTYINTWESQQDLKDFRQDIMMLSVTNAKLKIGNWIYLWALRNGYLKDPEKYSRINTYQHFELINEARLDIYDFMSRKLVGEHDFKLKQDDIINKNWKNKPTDNEKAIDQWQSNISFIHHSGNEIYGTRKYEGDPLQHMMETIHDIIIIKMSPFIECEHGNLNDQGTYDPCEICRDDCLLTPELYSYEQLMFKMEEDYEAWFSEMMQNPHPRKGGMVDDSDLQWIPGICKHTLVSKCGIGVDCAWTEGETSDMTGIVSILSMKAKREFRVVNQDTGKWPIRTIVKNKKTILGILERIQRQFEYLSRYYPETPITVAIERNTGGIVIIDQARREMDTFTFAKHICEDITPAYIKRRAKNPDTPVRLGITHSKEKVARIFGELQHPIKKGQVKFSDLIYGSILITQVVTFPKSRYDDGVDALGMIKDVLNKMWSGEDIEMQQEELIKHFKAQKRKAYETAWHDSMMEPWNSEGGKRSGLRDLFGS